MKADNIGAVARMPANIRSGERSARLNHCRPTGAMS